MIAIWKVSEEASVVAWLTITKAVFWCFTRVAR